MDEARLYGNSPSLFIFLLRPVGEAIVMAFCLSVCEHISETARPIFIKSFKHVTWLGSFSGGVEICYVLPVLWVTSYLHIHKATGSSVGVSLEQPASLMVQPGG